jgi:hypothetical protein
MVNRLGIDLTSCFTIKAMQQLVKPEIIAFTALATETEKTVLGLRSLP